MNLGDELSATATLITGGVPVETSEFSNDVMVIPPIVLGAPPLNPSQWTANFAGFSATVTASGGATGPAFAFSIVSGALPTGMSIAAATGVISGIPTAAGTFTFTVQAQQNGAAGPFGQQSYTITINPAVTLSPASPLTNGAVNAAYSQTVTALGGTGNKTVTLSGTLPTGLTSNSPATNSLTISGTPTMAGPFNFTITAVDSLGATTGAVAYSITITNGITITKTSLPNWTIGQSYNQTITTTGQASAPVFTVSVGALPERPDAERQHRRDHRHAECGQHSTSPSRPPTSPPRPPRPTRW